MMNDYEISQELSQIAFESDQLCSYFSERGLSVQQGIATCLFLFTTIANTKESNRQAMLSALKVLVDSLETEIKE